ncbi:MAG: acetyl-CoA carboxylase biotin carboxylase subunit [Candidatus Azotimanducaceae bacterium]|jgi:acetyl-CoA carboxylase biotin carboxylase subunit
MLQKVLIANRGEIALRILQTCHEMGKQCVAAYTKVDADLRHVSLADENICISRKDYLNADSLITAAKLTGCDSIHPGYGFLSENAEFAEKVEANGLVFIGPKHTHISELGDKASARQLMSSCGLSPLTGSVGSLKSLEEAKSLAADIGYPVLLKAAFGGGGRGIRLLESEEHFDNVYFEATSEAETNFGRGELYLEKYLSRARHIEIQILGDGKGEVIHLGSRDCSVQRRHQKIVEEAPAYKIDASLLEELAQKVVSAMSGLQYQSAATLEFLYQDNVFYFLEINTRIQVEHPITEMIYGVDLVKAQLLIADTEKLPYLQSDLSPRGCAIECRVNAEDANFRPSPGLVTRFDPPGGNGVRVDSHVYTGYRVPHYYDSLLAKLIVHGVDREDAIGKMQRALVEFKIEGIDTGLEKLLDICTSPEFVLGNYDTQLLSGET